MKMARASAAIMFFLATVFAVCAFGKPAAAAARFFKVNYPGCNADVFTQIPDMPDLFIGRQMNVTQANSCNGNGWSLVLLQMDWTTHQLKYVRTIFQTPAIVDDGSEQIKTAHDPYIAKFNGEYWIAFECAGKDIVGGSTCIGPFDPKQPSKGMDLNRTYVIVYGKSAIAGDKYFYSASDPKLLSFQNHLYLYWTAVKGWHPPGAKQHQWLSIATRGMELQQQTSGRRLVWGKGMDGPDDSYDPAHNVEVWGPNPNDPNSDQTVDMFSIMSVGNVIFATAGVGGNGEAHAPPPPPDIQHPGCVVPDPTKDGCFRIALAASTSPMGEHVFDGMLAPQNILPPNTQEYARLYRQPDGSLFLMARFFRKWPAPALYGLLPDGIDYIPLPANSPLVQWMDHP